MKKVLLHAFLFFLFIFQGTVMQVFSPEWFGYDFTAVPHFLLLVVLMTAVFHDRRYATITGAVFGLLVDLIYTDTIGIYAFTIAFNAYLLSYFKKVFHTYLPVFLLMALIAVALMEIQVYEIYTLIGKANVDFQTYLTERLPATLVLNAAVFILMYYPLRRYLVGLPVSAKTAKD